MINTVEILRAICFTEKDLEEITNLGDMFSKKEIEFMIEFKKIYELGTDQLEKFITKLVDEGSELDPYTIQYYVNLLRNGPLGSHTREFSKGKTYFVNIPDSMGMLGNKNKSYQNNTIFIDGAYPLGCAVDSYNKLPTFMQKNLSNAIKTTEDVFRGSLKSSSEIDNTLPIIDKNNQMRYAEEGKGLFVKNANGSYMIKDSCYYIAIEESSPTIFEKVEGLIGSENFRIYSNNKKYTPFDSRENTSTAIPNKIEKNFYDKDKKNIITLDLMGDEFDSEENRKTKLKIIGTDKDKEYLLNTNAGQLGN
jgi:hypothetical protein